MPVEPFALALEKRGLFLTRRETTMLQINVGTLCNQVCRHCHLDAGPNSHEIMGRDTVEEIAVFARRGQFRVADITGGAPELNPNLSGLIGKLFPVVPRIMLRSNLTAIAEPRRDYLIDLCSEHRVAIVASLPSLNSGQTDSMRGKGVWEKSLSCLRRLNSVGYGVEGTGLELDIVSNPVGAFLPVSQEQAEKKFRQDLGRKFGIVFSNLYTFANVPLGRFRRWLIESGNFDRYMERLASSFNPCTLEGLMCRTLVSVSWEGHLHDCDFNLAGGLHIGGRRTHVSEMEEPPLPGTPIAVSDHCYACTAGSGFT